MLRLLRFLQGYVCFTVSGRFPERFINIALKNGIRLWNVARRDDTLSACMYMRDYLRIRRYARASGVKLRVSARRGLPTCLRRYSDRAGVIVGAAAFAATVFVMSLFVWSIDVSGLDTVSESEIRALLRENGVCIGAFKPSLDYGSISRAIMLDDDRIGWMAVNADGSYVSVEIKEKSPSPEVTDIHTPCNVKASRDGRILRIESGEGKTVIMEGSGVVGGQLIVSGVMEDKLGGQRLVAAQASVIAETSYHTSFSVPASFGAYFPTGEVRYRYTADIFGWKLPLTIAGVSTADRLCDETESVPAPLDVRLPIGLLTRRIEAMHETVITPDKNSAKELLRQEARLYEIFALSNCTVTDRKYRIVDTADGYALNADYVCIEDIAYTEPIGTDAGTD